MGKWVCLHFIISSWIVVTIFFSNIIWVNGYLNKILLKIMLRRLFYPHLCWLSLMFLDPLKLLRETEKVVRRNGESATKRLDRMMSNALNALTSEVNLVLFPGGLQKPFPNNCLSLMTLTGAKGGLVNSFFLFLNLANISCR